MVEYLPTDNTIKRYARWGHNLIPQWEMSDIVTAPDSSTPLITLQIPVSVAGFIYGFYISADESNVFNINWTSYNNDYYKRIIFPCKGTIEYTSIVPLNEGLFAQQNSEITVTIENNGNSNKKYHVGLLIGYIDYRTLARELGVSVNELP